MKIAILNASNPQNIQLESDEYVDLRDRKSCFNGNRVIKQCRSWHSWAYALESEFFVYNKQGWPGVFKYDGVVVLVNREIGKVVPIVQKLKQTGKKVGISFHEGVADLLHTPGQKWIDLKNLVGISDFYLNIFGQYQKFFEGWFGKEKVKFVNHTAPFDWEHGLTIPWDERTGDILCGTRTFNQRLSRNTFVTLATFSGWQKENPERRIDFITEDGAAKQIFDMIQSFGLNNITVHQGPLDYNGWLRFLSNYKYVVHHDLSMNLGQISLDCLMLDIIPVGGTTWLNIELGTDDCGNVLNILDIIDGATPDATDIVRLKNRLRPNSIKKNLIEVFKK